MIDPLYSPIKTHGFLETVCFGDFILTFIPLFQTINDVNPLSGIIDSKFM